MDSNQRRFIEDALDLLNELDEGLLQLEANPHARAPLEQVFRTMHTVKGAANMFGFENIGMLAHHLETLFDYVRQQRMQVTDDLISITLQAFDKVRDLLKETDIARITSPDALKDHLARAIEFHRMADASVSADGGATALQKDELVTFAIDIVPTLTITEDGNHPLIFIIQDIAALGTAHTRVLKGTANNIEKWEVYVATTVSQEELESYFIFVEGDCGVNFRRLASYSLFDLPDFTTYLTSLGDAAADPERLLAIAGEKLSQGDTMIADEEPLAAGKKKIFNETYIKVNKQNIDNLLNWISELIILQARFANAAAAIESTELKDATEELYRVTHQLRDTSLEIGLVPVETLVTKFKRLVRDLSKTLDKKVNFLSEGAETKVDKDVIELMADPMIHLIRNAIDHGIEKAADRRASGKAEHGTVKLKAFTAGSYVNITISDDGKGIHKEHVLRKAVEKGIVSKDAMLSDEEILQLIFHSGLSTAASVSDVSGRGVGMDVVKQKIQELRGDVSIKSFPGEGTSVHIRLPMSRSIIEGLLVRIGSSEYILPLTAVDKCYEVPTASLSSDHCQKVMLDGTLVPVFYMQEVFEERGARPSILQVIKIHHDGYPVGITVDMILGEYQTVLKPLGDAYQHQEEFSGATILGDGRVALVFDTNKLVKRLILQPG